MRVLIVEDDLKMAGLIQEFLDAHGLEASITSDGQEAIKRILDEQPDAVVLDWMLPGCDGLTVCREVRSRFNGAILMLTARRSDFDQVVGLEIGADDYITKPVEPRVLLARIRSQIRARAQASSEGPTHPHARLGALCLDAALREVTIDGEVVPLTGAELELLEFLMRRAGEVVTRDTLYQELRGIEYDGLDRGMDIHISRIRRKLLAAGLERDPIKTVRGVGYFVVATA